MELGTRFTKITRAAGRIRHGLQEKLFLGNLAARRDWGYAPEFVEGMWLMLQQEEPDDFVLATGEAHSVEEFCVLAFERAGMPLVFEWEGEQRRGVDAEGKVRVSVDPRYYRPTEVDQLIGDPTKAREKLGWAPETLFADLVSRMVDNDMALAKGEAGSGSRYPTKNQEPRARNKQHLPDQPRRNQPQALSPAHEGVAH